MQYVFGSGVLYATPLTDFNGAAITNPTPVKLAASQDISVDLSFDTKQLYGQNQFPLAVGRGKGKVSIKAKFAQVNGRTLNSIFLGQTLAAGQVQIYTDITSGTAIPTTPFTITPTVPSSGVWAADLGVTVAALGTNTALSVGSILTRVASAPTTGQYSVAAGVYTFSTADNAAGMKVNINYQYTVAATGQKSTVVNALLGSIPTFQTDIVVPYNGQQVTFSFPNCAAGKFSIATKLDDFAIPSLDIDAFANAAGTVFSYSLAE